MRIVIYPFSLHSEAAIALRDFIREKGKKCFFAKADGNFSPEPGDFIFGWGYSKCPKWANKVPASAIWLNRFDRIENAVNKLTTFDILSNEDVQIPSITRSIICVKKWLKAGETVLARKRIKGSQGAGIDVLTADSLDHIPDAKFYTKVEPSTAEFRVYVLNGKVVDTLEKRKQNGGVSSTILRTEENGWVFCRKHVVLPAKCAEESKRACSALGLDFGGVDILWNGNTGKATVLEINTAPGVFGSGVPLIGEALLNYQKGAQNAL